MNYLVNQNLNPVNPKLKIWIQQEVFKKNKKKYVLPLFYGLLFHYFAPIWPAYLLWKMKYPILARYCNLTVTSPLVSSSIPLFFVRCWKYKPDDDENDKLTTESQRSRTKKIWQQLLMNNENINMVTCLLRPIEKHIMYIVQVINLL